MNARQAAAIRDRAARARLTDRGTRSNLAAKQRAHVRQEERHELTAREVQVIQGIADGLNTARIADALGISPHTVKSHLRKATLIVGARNRTHLVTYAFRRKLIT